MNALKPIALYLNQRAGTPVLRPAAPIITMIHTDTISSYPGTLSDLAEDIGNLKYDALAEFLHALSEKLAIDAGADQGRGRAKLAAALYDCSRHLDASATSIDAAWAIAKPFMDDKDKE